MINPLQNGTPPIKQPWGLLIQGKHYMIHHCPQKVGWRTFLNKALRGQRISQISRDLDYVQFLLTKLFLGWICWGNTGLGVSHSPKRWQHVTTMTPGESITDCQLWIGSGATDRQLIILVVNFESWYFDAFWLHCPSLILPFKHYKNTHPSSHPILARASQHD